jgi:hypothetical protein
MASSSGDVPGGEPAAPPRELLAIVDGSIVPSSRDTVTRFEDHVGFFLPGHVQGHWRQYQTIAAAAQAFHDRTDAGKQVGGITRVSVGVYELREGEHLCPSPSGEIAYLPQRDSPGGWKLFPVIRRCYDLQPEGFIRVEHAFLRGYPNTVDGVVSFPTLLCAVTAAKLAGPDCSGITWNGYDAYELRRACSPEPSSRGETVFLKDEVARLNNSGISELVNSIWKEMKTEKRKRPDEDPDFVM